MFLICALVIIKAQTSLQLSKSLPNSYYTSSLRTSKNMQKREKVQCTMFKDCTCPAQTMQPSLPYLMVAYSYSLYWLYYCTLSNRYSKSLISSKALLHSAIETQPFVTHIGILKVSKRMQTSDISFYKLLMVIQPIITLSTFPILIWPVLLIVIMRTNSK